MFGSTNPCGVFGAAQSSSSFSSTTTLGASSSPTFGSSVPAFGSSSTPASGVSTAPMFGAGAPFGASSKPIFGSSTTSAFGASSTPLFGASSTPAFGTSTAPSFSFRSTQTFGQSTSACGSSPFGSNASPFGSQSSPFGSQSTASAFGCTGVGQSGFGRQRGGSRVASYTATTEADAGTSGQAGKLESISAMPICKDESHEELRLEDYQVGDKGGPLPSAQSSGLGGFRSSTTQTNTFATPSAFGQSSASPFSTSVSSNPFAPESSTFSTGFGTSASPFSPSGFGASTSSTVPSLFSSSTSAFGANSSPSPGFGQFPFLFSSTPSQGTGVSASPFSLSGFGASTSATAPSLFASSTSAFGANSSPSPGFGQSPSLFSSAPSQVTSPFSSNINFGNTQSSKLFNSTPAQTGSTTDSKSGNPMTEPKQITEASPQILKETQNKIVQSSAASEEPALITSLTASQENEIETPQETDDLAKKGSMNKMISKDNQEQGEIRFQVHSEVVIKETEKDILQNCPAPHKPAMAASSTKSPSSSIISDETIKQTMDPEGCKSKCAMFKELSPQVIKEIGKEILQNRHASEKLAMAPTPAPNPSAMLLQKTISLELDEQQTSELCSTSQQQPLEVPQTDNIASNVVEEPINSAPKIAISEKSITLPVSTYFKRKNSTAESLVFPAAEAYPKVIKNSENAILQNCHDSKKPEMANSSAPSTSRSAILFQHTTSHVVREPVKSSFAESDAVAIAESKETQAQRTQTQIQERRAIEGSVVEELNRIEDDMKAFYASIEKECYVMPIPENPCASIESLNVRASEETQKALEILQELLCKKFTLLLHPGRSCLMSNVLEYLLSLSREDGISSTMKSIMEELSSSFRKWSLDYNNANVKLDSATANLSKIEKLEEGLEANIKEFREVAKLENGVCSHLAYLEARKRELEAEIAHYKSARDTVAERKRQVFEDGKKLKAEKDDLWKRAPQLRDEQEWARTTKSSIECEWSKLGQQFMRSSGFDE